MRLPVFAMLMTSSEDILERVVNLPIMGLSTCVCHAHSEDTLRRVPVARISIMRLPVFAMLMTSSEDILERVVNLPIMDLSTCVCLAHDHK
jgi:hypothetical protein